MKSPFIGSLVPNDVVTAQFLVLSKEIRQKKTGEHYLALHLADRTGEVEAKMWDNVSEVMHTFDRDDFVKVKGLLQLYQSRSQFTIHKLRRLEDHEVDLADYFPCSDRDPNEMFAELQQMIAGFQNQYLHALLDAVFADTGLTSLYKMAPAAKTIHHACRGGLIEHVLSLCALAKITAAHYKNIDVDLLIAGVILHDIGKVEELSFSRSFGYSADGQLLGHIILGLRLVGAKIDQVPDFPPKLRSLLEHMILSHHGELEFGSPKVPIFAEALLLHHLDNMDSKMDALRSALRRDQQSDGEFTGWIGPLERVLLKKERYLQEKPIRAAAPTSLAHEDRAAEPKTTGEKPVEAGPPSVAAPVPLPSTTIREPHRATPHASPANTLFAEKLRAVLDPSS